MLDVKETNQGWIIETDDARVLTAIKTGLKRRIENTEHLMNEGIGDVEMAIKEIRELRELLEKIWKTKMNN